MSLHKMVKFWRNLYIYTEGFLLKELQMFPFIKWSNFDTYARHFKILTLTLILFTHHLKYQTMTSNLDVLENVPIKYEAQKIRPTKAEAHYRRRRGFVLVFVEVGRYLIIHKF